MLDAIFDASFVFAALRAASPILLAGLGAVFTERANVPNIGVEGMMLVAAFFSVLATIGVGNVWIGLLAGIAAAAAAAAIMAFFAVDLRADIIVAGFAINTLAGGVSIFLLSTLYGQKGSLRESGMAALPDLELPLVAAVPLLGEMVSGHNIMVYLGWILVAVSVVVLYRTPFGVRLRAVGEDPEAAESVGIGVRRYRYFALLLGGVFAGLAGANLAVGFLASFVRDMTAGRGFIALAAALFGARRPVGTLIAALLFGAAQGLANQLQASDLPSDLVLMTPYVVTAAALIGYSIRRTRQLSAPAKRTAAATATTGG